MENNLEKQTKDVTINAPAKQSKPRPTQKKTPKKVFHKVSTLLAKTIKTGQAQLQNQELTTNIKNFLQDQQNKIGTQFKTLKEKTIDKKDLTNVYSALLLLAVNAFLFNVSLLLKLEKKIISPLVTKIKKMKADDPNEPNQQKLELHKIEQTVQAMIQRVKQYEQEIQRQKQALETERQNNTQLLTKLSHELRTPLHTIMGYTQILLLKDGENQNQKLTPRQKKWIEKIHASGTHLQNIMDDVIEMARLSRHGLMVKKEEIEVIEIMEQAIELVEPIAQKQNIEIRTLLPRNSEYIIEADAKRLKQVFINLLTNAIKYNKPNGRVLIRMDQNEHTLTISIQDTGIGIPKQHHEKIFQPFSRVAPKTKKVDGTGIGLTLVKEFVEAMNGTVHLMSEENEGTEFTLTFQTLQKKRMSHTSPGHGSFFLLHDYYRYITGARHHPNFLVSQKCFTTQTLCP